MADRADLLKNAVAFLSDSKTQEASLAQRIQFLESKGLTSGEIDEAIRHAHQVSPGSQSPSSITYSRPRGTPYSTGYAPSVYGLSAHPPPRELDWRDYLIMAIASGGLMYGAVALARKYLFPHLQPPSQTQYEADVSALNAQFDAIEQKLQDIQADCEATRQAAESQRERISSLADQVQVNLDVVRENERKNRDELREIREEVDLIRDMLPKMIEKGKEGSNTAMLDLQQELRSLKSLILNSGGRGPASPIPVVPPPATRPTIPAWQLGPASSGQTSNEPEVGDSEAKSPS